MTKESRSAAGRKGGSNVSLEQRRRNGLKAGRIAGRKNADLRKTGAFVRGRCPHCGFESNVMVLGRCHFARCKMRPKMTRGN